MSAPLTLRGEALSKHYPMGGAIFGRRSLVAVDAVDLELVRGRTLALVGESGCGKSTVGRLLLGLLAPTSGRALLGGCDFAAMPKAEWRRLRRHCQMIFQDPAAALNPRRTVREALEEPFAIHEPELAPAAREERIQALRARVGLGAEHLHRFPAGLSGGQRQRLVIARALALDPAFLFADEPVASLDVSVRAQVLNLLVELQRERDLGCLFVSHDLQVVRHLADDIAIMYLGRIVERAEAAAFFARPAHPYARVLLSSLPGAGGRILLEGEVPSPLAPPPGCPFHPRCPVYRRLTAAEQARCRGERPQLLALPDDGARQVACHFPGAP